MCKCEQLKIVKQYDYNLSKLPLSDKDVSYFQYRIYKNYFDEYLIFVNTKNYKITQRKYLASNKSYNVVSLFEISGEYDFILKYLTTERDYKMIISCLSKDKGEMIKLFKVQERYILENQMFTPFDENSIFQYCDIVLKDYYIFENFIKIDYDDNVDLISFLNARRNLSLQFIYIVYKVIDVSGKNKKNYWIVCTRYKCCDYLEGQESIQSLLNDFADNKGKGAKKTTYNSKSNTCINEHLEKLYSDIDLEYVVKDFLFEHRTEFAKDGTNSIWKEPRKNSFIHKLNTHSLGMIAKTDKSLTFQELMDNIRNSEIYFSYKWNKNNDGISEIECLKLFNWLTMNGFSNIHRDVKDKKNIGPFMEKLTRSNYLVVCANEAYFKSVNCMYELTKYTMLSKSLDRRMLLISNYITDGKEQGAIIKYWRAASENGAWNQKKTIYISRHIETVIEQISKLLIRKPVDESINKEAVRGLLGDLCNNIINGYSK